MTPTKVYRCLVCVNDDDTLDQMERFQQTNATIVHFENPRSAAPKKFFRHKPKNHHHGGDKDDSDKWLKCEMKITRVGDVALRAAYVKCGKQSNAKDPEIALAHRLWGPHQKIPEKGAKYVMDIDVELITKEWRPHQLRGQLAALGCPIVGDEIYGGGVCETGGHRHTWNRVAVQCCQLDFVEPEWSTSDEGKKMLVPSKDSKECHFRLESAW
eukprot:CAMPEP_0178756826 /NCGR_PEP_ID=MMETSP0744-20121128/13490_1 /TAXON_ID=913974 /ORGANISM="Nitzschia punctata, Strain CCMP561" /LENGTH=212 /DNA_ID=CAMNT_0020411011 /DNA_START=116 /DNA_END=752 /DNA_ORIENTATION=-